MRAKKVNENIGFNRSGDPKTSLGLGGYTFESLRDGSILMVKKSFGLTNTGNFQSYNGATNKYVWGSHVIVMDLRKLGDNYYEGDRMLRNNYYIGFKIISSGSFEYMYGNNPEGAEMKRLESLKKAQDNQQRYLTGGTNSFPAFQQRNSIKTIDKVGKQKFNNLFEIIQPG